VPSQRADCVARLRIFTPLKELDFAGHPTLGTAFVLIQMGHVRPEAECFAVEENVGAIAIAVDRTERSMLWLRTPPVHDSSVSRAPRWVEGASCMRVCMGRTARTASMSVVS
jgi:PhzF family phenazine biosynthesis protein